MPLNGRWTLTRYLIEERRRYPQASGELNALILDVALACKAIARVVASGALGSRLLNGSTATTGAVPQPLDGVANDIFERMNEWNGHLAGIASAAIETPPTQIPANFARGGYLLVFDPLDGLDSIDVNVPVGSLFSILRAPEDVLASGRDVTEADFLQPGTNQVAAGYAIYGPATMIVLTVGNGVAGFTLDPTMGEFVLSHRQIQIGVDTTDFAINTSNRRFWEPPIQRYVDECMAGKAGARGKDYNMRWIASLVAETHRILMRGGVFMYPRDTKDPAMPSPLQLLFEANPIAFIVEQAGGRASTGRQPVLALEPSGLHQRIGFVFGSRNEVERIERYHREPATREPGLQLFAERSLFRD